MKRNKLTKTGNYISKKIGNAIGKYDMINEGDRILLGLSGGKDSMTLFHMLKHRQCFAPVKYDIIVAHVDFGVSKKSIKEPLQALCAQYDVPFVFTRRKISFKNDKSNCFWCSWNRRKVFFDLAKKFECNKIALGHHKDDIIETTLLNMFFLGDFSTMNPSQKLFDGRVSIIRPLCYVEEKKIIKFAKESHFMTAPPCCEHGLRSNRAYIKKLITEVSKRSPYVKNNIFRSVARIKQEYIDLREE